MSSASGKLRVFIANLVWLASCIPGWIAFHFASKNVQKTQTRILSRIIKANRSTQFGRKHHFKSMKNPDDFKSIPMSDYENYSNEIDCIKNGEPAVLTSEPIELLQPTSGSTHATKLIPYTRTLRNEFKAAIDPWIASLYFNNPKLLLGRHYWSISPSTKCPAETNCKVPVGFADDSAYLGSIQRRLAQTLFAVPAELSRVADHNSFEYLTLLFLSREKNLRLISIWHPSFLTVLLNSMTRNIDQIRRDIETGSIDKSLRIDAELRSRIESRLKSNPTRARELAAIDFSSQSWPQKVWPDLRVISCWTDGNSEPWLSELKAAFPRATIQGKGLTATEGIVSFPIGRDGNKVCAIGSHYLEFIDETGGVFNSWELQSGKDYSVVLTTGGGLYRYRLHDVVRVSGSYRQAPILDFISRDNLISDLVGEKLDARHVEASIHRVEAKIGSAFNFAMLAPEQHHVRAGYILFVESNTSPDPNLIADNMEIELGRNYHYRHARDLGQLAPVRVLIINENAAEIYRAYLIKKGMKAGDIKFHALSRNRDWMEAFRPTPP